jgi:hypothetical protein
MRPAVVWIGIVVALLAMSVTGHAVLLFSAIYDPSFAIEPDYERKAANWDEIQRLKRQSAELGWTVSLGTTPGRQRGDVDLRLQLVDRLGDPITDATVELDAFHNARAGRILRGHPVHQADGVYEETLPARRSGVWEFRLNITRGEEVYVGTIRKSVVVPLRSAGQGP